MKTGDLIIFTAQGKGSWNVVTGLISMFTWSKYVHVGIVLEDPKFLNLEGLYLWESAWTNVQDSENHQKKFGVQISPLAERIADGHAYIRRYKGSDFPLEDLVAVHELVHNKPYDIVPLDWVEGIVGLDSKPKKTSRFWCSALIGYILTQLKVLPVDTDWSILTPRYFAELKSSLYGSIKPIYKI